MDLDGEESAISPVKLQDLFVHEEVKLQLRMAETAKAQVCASHTGSKITGVVNGAAYFLNYLPNLFYVCKKRIALVSSKLLRNGNHNEKGFFFGLNCILIHTLLQKPEDSSFQFYI